MNPRSGLAEPKRRMPRRTNPLLTEVDINLQAQQRLPRTKQGRLF
jgi:hypothetical protein